MKACLASLLQKNPTHGMDGIFSQVERWEAACVGETSMDTSPPTHTSPPSLLFYSLLPLSFLLPLPLPPSLPPSFLAIPPPLLPFLFLLTSSLPPSLPPSFPPSFQRSVTSTPVYRVCTCLYFLLSPPPPPPPSGAPGRDGGGVRGVHGDALEAAVPLDS